MLFFGKSDVGKKRAVNQDRCFISEYSDSAALCVVCDGMGGVHGGAEASATAIDAFSSHIQTFIEQCPAPNKADVSQALEHAVSAANDAVKARADEDETLAGMGTTLVCALILDRTVYAANVGDSRMYLITEHGIKQITRDHSYVQYLVDAGSLTPDEARHAPNKNIITRAVGTEESVEADIFEMTLSPDADTPVYGLLCSDGLSNQLSDDEIAHLVMEGGDELEATVCKLIDRANDSGGPDNITAVLFRL